ncbi:MAG: AEC family transporter [Eubacterium ventriosum]
MYRLPTEAALQYLELGIYLKYLFRYWNGSTDDNRCSSTLQYICCNNSYSGMSEKGAGQSKTLSSTLKGIATNHIILSIVAGVILSVLNVHFPKMLDNTISNFSKMATPLALIAIGGSFEFGKALQKIKPAVIATAMKLVGWALVFLPIAIWLGYRDAKINGNSNYACLTSNTKLLHNVKKYAQRRNSNKQCYCFDNNVFSIHNYGNYLYFKSNRTCLKRKER